MVFDCQGEQLVGILHSTATGGGEIGVVVVVGGPQYRVGSHRQFALMARLFADAGYPVLRFDYRGMGDSDGGTANFERVDEDISAAIEALKRTLPAVTRVVLWGLCDGASACLMYVGRHNLQIRDVVIVNPWVRTQAGEARAYLKHYYLQRMMQLEFWKKAFTGRLSVLQSLRDFGEKIFRARRTAQSDEGMDFLTRMFRGFSELQGSTLVLTSERDLTAQEFVEFAASNRGWHDRLACAGVQSKRFAAADHTFSRRADLEAMCRCCIEWLDELAAASR